MFLIIYIFKSHILYLDRSQFIPVQKIEYLRFTYDSTSVTTSLTDVKQQRTKILIGEALQREKIKIRQILGASEASSPVIKFRHPYMFYLQKCKIEALKLNKGNYEGVINLTEIYTGELQCWQKRVEAVSDIYHPLLQLRIYSDASPNGWSAACRKYSTGKTGLRKNHLCILMC